MEKNAGMFSSKNKQETTLAGISTLSAEDPSLVWRGEMYQAQCSLTIPDF